MTVTATAVANEFLMLADDEGVALTPMQIIKLTYLTHGYYLAIADEPLLDETVEAGRYGPIVPSLYRRLAVFGNEPVDCEIADIDHTHSTIQTPKISKKRKFTRLLIKKIYDVYGNLSGMQLSELTHKPGTPWSETTDNGEKLRKGQDIQDEVIRNHFLELLGPEPNEKAQPATPA